MNNSDINLRLTSVRETSPESGVNRRALRHMRHDARLEVDMRVDVRPDMAREMVEMRVECEYRGVVDYIQTSVLRCGVEAVFEIDELPAHVTGHGGEFVTDGPLMMLMLGIAVGSLRGVVAVKTAGTLLASEPLPIIDLSALMYRLHYGERPPEGIVRV